jgi:hypothetical protein
MTRSTNRKAGLLRSLEIQGSPQPIDQRQALGQSPEIQILRGAPGREFARTKRTVYATPYLQHEARVVRDASRAGNKSFFEMNKCCRWGFFGGLISTRRVTHSHLPRS